MTAEKGYAKHGERPATAAARGVTTLGLSQAQPGGQGARPEWSMQELSWDAPMPEDRRQGGAGALFKTSVYSAARDRAHERRSQLAGFQRVAHR